MIKLDELNVFLDNEFKIASISDKCQNGLQFEGKQEIKKIGLCVDLTLNTILKAIDEKCDIIISHHALIWKPVSVFDGLLADKLKHLAKNDISVYVAHHPMDVHRKYSHGKIMAGELGLSGISDFGFMDGVYFGVKGNLKRSITLDDFKSEVDKKLSSNSVIYKFGKEKISSVSIISGGGGFFVENAVKETADCYFTGEMKHSELMQAKDLGINVLLAGHYETEKYGLIKLSQTLTKKFKIECFFIAS